MQAFVSKATVAQPAPGGIHAGLARARIKGVRLRRPPALERQIIPAGLPTRRSPRARSP
jgi:hypothetical protein